MYERKILMSSEPDDSGDSADSGSPPPATDSSPFRGAAGPSHGQSANAPFPSGLGGGTLPIGTAPPEAARVTKWS